MLFLDFPLSLQQQGKDITTMAGKKHLYRIQFPVLFKKFFLGVNKQTKLYKAKLLTYLNFVLSLIRLKCVQRALSNLSVCNYHVAGFPLHFSGQPRNKKWTVKANKLFYPLCIRATCLFVLD